VWNSSGFDSGYYRIIGEVEDTAGVLLDKKLEMILIYHAFMPSPLTLYPFFPLGAALFCPPGQLFFPPFQLIFSASLFFVDSLHYPF
jgi:hypothetical protein